MAQKYLTTHLSGSPFDCGQSQLPSQRYPRLQQSNSAAIRDLQQDLQGAFEWTKEADGAFHHLKNVIADNRALYLPNFGFTWYLFCDWSAVGGSWSLMQREKDTSGAWRQVLFGSRPNSKSERNYSSYFGEAFNIVNAINNC